MESNHAHMEQFTRGSCSNQHQHYPHTHTHNHPMKYLFWWFAGKKQDANKPAIHEHVWICSQRGFEESSYTLFGSGNLFDKFKQHVWNNVAYWTLHEGTFPSLEPAELRLSGFEAKVRKVSCRDLGLAWVKMMIRELWWLCWMASWSDEPMGQIQHGHQWSTIDGHDYRVIGCHRHE